MSKRLTSKYPDIDGFFNRQLTTARQRRQKKMCYIVVASSGDYEDKSWWIVAVFLSKSDADLHAEMARTTATKVIEKHNERLRKYFDDKTGTAPDPGNRGRFNKFDAEMCDQCGGGCPSYAVSEFRLMP